MARGRMLNKSVCLSMKFQQLPDDTCRLLATWTIPHLDKHGVFYGDPTIVKSLVFPMRPDISVATVEQNLKAMQSVGLIALFTAEGRVWQCWPGFADNQTNLRAERETTDYPDPPEEAAESGRPKDADAPQDARNGDGNNPAEIRIDAGQKPAESNLSKVNIGANAPIATDETPPQEFSTPTIADSTRPVAHEKFFLPSGDAVRRKIANARVAEDVRQTMLDFHDLFQDATYVATRWKGGAESLRDSYHGDRALLREGADHARRKGVIPNNPGGLVWAVDAVKDARRQKPTGVIDQGDEQLVQLPNGETRTVRRG